MEHQLIIIAQKSGVKPLEKEYILQTLICNNCSKKSLKTAGKRKVSEDFKIIQRRNYEKCNDIWCG